jgi:hypothetical protein
MVSPRANYNAIFADILSGLPDGEVIDASVLLSDARLPDAVSVKTKKEKLKSFLDENPSWIRRITGIVPKPETIIALVESEIGPINEGLLAEANVRCSSVVGSAVRPMLARFVREELAEYYSSPGTISLSEECLLQFLDEFSNYIKAAGNGLVSVAGSINEKLLHRAMENAGMVKGEHFSITGTDSEADIQVYTRQGTRESLGVEVKSYAARERLLRGLRDVREPKVGVGFFRNPAEFGLSRTITYLQARPAAIYMPRATLELVESGARSQRVNEKVAFGSFLYRPLEQFVSDMKAYYYNGILPEYSG